jgi:hypothetical protein
MLIFVGRSVENVYKEIPLTRTFPQYVLCARLEYLIYKESPLSASHAKLALGKACAWKIALPGCQPSRWLPLLLRPRKCVSFLPATTID